MDRFDRQRQIFGDEGQNRIAKASAAVAGVGGLGSFVVLELAYLGIGKIVMVDPKYLERPNRNRLVGAWASHSYGIPKVEILRDLVSLVDPAIQTIALYDDVESAVATRLLGDVDVVVGCFDHDGPRFVFNEYCCTHDLPLIDAATDTIPEADRVLFGGRVCVVTPETGCLMCLNVLDQNELQDYFDSASQKTDRDAIYGVRVSDLAGGGPSVVTVNGVVASIAATELMALITGIRPPIAHQEWRGHDVSLRRIVDREDDCYYCGLRSSTAN